MLQVYHYDDGKEKSQSHEIDVRESHFYNAEYGVFSHNPLDLIGYGGTKKEALEDFKLKFGYVMQELKAFEKTLLETDVIKNSIVELDRPN